MVTKEAIVLGGEKGLYELGRNLIVAHRNAPLLADGGDQAPVARIDPQRHLQLYIPQRIHVGQGGLQIDVRADVGEGRQRDRSDQDDTNARDEN